jgi:hypothetical protein
MTSKPRQPLSSSRWFMPAFCLMLGIVILIASWLGGHPGSGAYSLAIMAGFGLLLVLAGRNETVRGLTVGRDERFAQIDLRATAVAGLALILTLAVAWLVQIAHGHSGNPYGWLLAVGGFSYAVAVAFFRWIG